MRAHYSYRPDDELARLQEAGSVIDVSRHRSVEELCLAADALITDYSSMMFDYAVLDRPVVIYADDWDIYRSSRGVYFDLLSGSPGETPGAVARTERELVEVFREGRWCDADATALRTAFRARFCRFDDGRAAERVVRALMLGQDLELPLAPTPQTRPLADSAPAGPRGGVLTAE
ncbi:CDP-glycerol glycerophosphotransferase family protein [Streptomyces indonesiensis]